MMTSDYIIDVSEADFEYQVLQYSRQMPVIVDFWAEWCAPCRVLGPILEKLAIEGQGSFRLAKVNVDENPGLAQLYQVRSIPVVKAFSDGRIKSEFSGLRPEPFIRDFIRSIAPNQSDLLIEKGNSLLQLMQPGNAENAFRQALDFSPNHPAALLGLVRSLLFQGKAQEAGSIISYFPPSREYSITENLQPLLEALLTPIPEPDSKNNPLHATYINALRLMKRGNFEAAMDGFLDILRQDKRFLDGLPRRIMLGIFELYGNESSITRQYRNELSLVLF